MGSSWYIGKIPANIEIVDTILISGESGFREGCGLAIFKLSEDTIKKIKTKGLSALKDARQARKYSDHFRVYSEWGETSYQWTDDGMTLKDRWLLGSMCANIDMVLSKDINAALKSPGSFYATIHEAGTIVIPNLGIVFFHIMVEKVR